MLGALVFAAVGLFILPRSGSVAVVWILAGQILECLLCGWAVAAPLGNANVGALSSIRFMARRLRWTVADQTQVIRQLIKEGYPVRAEDLQRLSPYGTQHLKRFGEYRVNLEGTDPSPATSLGL